MMIKQLWRRMFPPTVESVTARAIALGKDARYILKEVGFQERPLLLKDSVNYQVELVQVAASAIAALTDYRMQNNVRLSQFEIESQIVSEIIQERGRQDLKFSRTMPCCRDPRVYSLVLIEEVAETIEEIED